MIGDAGGAGPSRIRALTRAGAYGVVLAATIGVAYMVTRGEAAPASTSVTQDHAAGAATATAARSITLSPEEERRIGVTYAVATLGSFGKEVRTVAQVSIDETRVRTITARIDGWVDGLTVNATGQRVAEGQPLLTIYSPMLVSAQEELLLAKRLQVDIAGAAGDARRGADDLVAAGRRRLANWGIPESEIADIERGGIARKSLTLRSPAAGFVLDKRVIAGQKIMAGDVLYTVADLSVLWLEGEVFEQDLAAVRVGQTVHADFEALPGDHRMGRISSISPTLDADTRTTRVRVVISNADFRLKPGMYATLRIAGTERGGVVTVPRSAVLSTGERSIVFVREANGQLSPREVALGESSDDRVEVRRGLVAGQTVVASATFLVDAESNLGAALGGMGDMPGMELTTPPKRLPMKPGGRE